MKTSKPPTIDGVLFQVMSGVDASLNLLRALVLALGTTFAVTLVEVIDGSPLSEADRAVPVPRVVYVVAFLAGLAIARH